MYKASAIFWEEKENERNILTSVTTLLGLFSSATSWDGNLFRSEDTSHSVHTINSESDARSDEQAESDNEFL